MHADQLDRHGGLPGVRDEGLLASALARPVNLLGYRPDVGPFGLAAAYAFDIARNQAFIDENKRVAFVTAVTLLLFNGLRLDAAGCEAEHMVLQLAAGEIEEEVSADWHDRNTMPVIGRLTTVNYGERYEDQVLPCAIDRQSYKDTKIRSGTWMSVNFLCILKQKKYESGF